MMLLLSCGYYRENVMLNASYCFLTTARLHFVFMFLIQARVYTNFARSHYGEAWSCRGML